MIYFDRVRMFIDLEKHLIFALGKLQDGLLNDAISGMQTPEGKGDVWAETIKASAHIIMAQVTGGPWATLDEWGKGSLMDTSNPALSSYRTSGFWNPARKDLKIRSRPKGPYKDFFGRMRVAKGPGGRDLEEMMAKMPARFRDEMSDYGPMPPSHAFQTAMRWLVQNGRFQAEVQRSLQVFPWHRYMIVKNTKRGGSP